MPADNSTAPFDPIAHLNALLAPVGLTCADTGGTVSFAGADPIFASRHRLGACIGLPIMGCAVGAAAIWKMRSGQGQDLHLDLRQAIHGINPEYAWHPTINGEEYPHATASDNPFLLEPYQTRDGRWVMASGVYPHMVADWLRFLNCTNSEAAVQQAIRQWDAEALEDAAARAGLPLAICRRPEEWEKHPQGAVLAAAPVVSLRKIADSPAQPFAPGKRPLSGVRVLAFVHAVAGCVVGRTLAEQGAEVMCVTFPNHFEHDFIYDDANVGSRSCFLNLNDEGARARCLELLRDADVVVDNHRGHKLWEFGLAPEQLAAIKPGIISVSVRAYGLEGPWADRGGFDMNGSAASGMMVLEGSAEAPRLPPTSLINDYITGYMGALGATAALLRRAREGGSYQVSVSLTRNAMWYRSLGLVDPALAGKTPANRARDPQSTTGETPFGTLTRLAPPVQFSRTPGYWESPMLVVRGADKPQWQASAQAASLTSRLRRRLGRKAPADKAAKPAPPFAAEAPALQELLASAEAFIRRLHPQAMAGANLRCQFRIHPVGSFAVVIEDGHCQLVGGELANPCVTLLMPAATFTGVMRGEASGIKAYMTGKLKIQGDKMAAKRLLAMAAD